MFSPIPEYPNLMYHFIVNKICCGRYNKKFADHLTAIEQADEQLG
jgi:hypothetical protein